MEGSASIQMKNKYNLNELFVLVFSKAIHFRHNSFIQHFRDIASRGGRSTPSPGGFFPAPLPPSPARLSLFTLLFFPFAFQVFSSIVHREIHQIMKSYVFGPFIIRPDK